MDGLEERTVLKAFGYDERGERLKEKWGTWSEPKLQKHKKHKGENKDKEKERVFNPLNIDDELSSSEKTGPWHR